MITSKRTKEQIAFAIFRILGIITLGVLIWILGFICYNGISVMSWDFIFSYPEEGMTSGGIFPAIVGTLYLVLGSILIAFPLGVMSAIYTVEYAKNNWVTKLIRIMTNNLASIPSIVFGLFGMTLFVNTLAFGDSIIAGSLTLSLLILPVVIRTTEEALKAVPNTYRTGSMALGANKIQTIKRIILPTAFPHIVTGLVLSIGRVSGETAPILFTVVAYFLPKLPSSIFDQVMALPYHLYVLATSGTDIEKSRPVAYGTALVLILIVLLMNTIAGIIKNQFQKNKK